MTSHSLRRYLAITATFFLCLSWPALSQEYLVDPDQDDCELQSSSLLVMGLGHFDPSEARASLSAAFGGEKSEIVSEYFKKLEAKRSTDAIAQRDIGLRLLIRAADRGNAHSQYFLGTSFAKGHPGIPRNDAKAREWLQRAAGQGHGPAMIYFGAILATQHMNSADIEEAYFWLIAAEAHGDWENVHESDQAISFWNEDRDVLFEELERFLSREARSAAQDRALKWRPILEIDPCVRE